MQRIASYLSLAMVLLAIVYAIALIDTTGGVTTTMRKPVPATVAVIPSSTTSPTATFSNSQGTTSPARQIPEVKTGPVIQTVPPFAVSSSAPTKLSTPAVSQIAAPSLQISDNASLNTAAMTLRNALVNILCLVPVGSGLRSILGSGVVIDPKGIILTNAHIAQYFLLKDRGVVCTIRSGSPATGDSSAAPIYIPAAWIRANPDVLTEASPSGTGEYDFAFLAITGTSTIFSTIPLAITPPSAGTQIVIASYGAQFLQTEQILSNLFPTIVFGTVKEVFTFKANTIDVLSLGGSAAAQEGSSGGGVVDASGHLISTITTSTVSGSTDTRVLNAITASYIRGEYASETGQPLDFLLVEPTATSIAQFAPSIHSLEAMITAHL